MAFICLKNITAHVPPSFTLNIPEWTLDKKESWLISGKNGSGKSIFAKLILGELPYSGTLTKRFQKNSESAVSWVSPHLEQQILDEEIKNDDSEFLEGGFDHGRTAMEIIRSGNEKCLKENHVNALLEMLNIRHIAEKGYRFLSCGETRKVLIAKALIRDPELIILETPYAGLDAASRLSLKKALENLIKTGTQLIIIGSMRESYPQGIDHMLYLDDGTVLMKGKIENIRETPLWKKLYHKDINLPHMLPETTSPISDFSGEKIIEMHDVSVSYNDQPVFEHLTWALRQKEHWSIIGPNGSGKSTLLSMISGDNPKAYGKDIWLFGRKKGSGESIWDIKKQIGFVSPDFHRNYRVNATVSNVIISGMFDSIGVYDPITPMHTKAALKWLELIGMEKTAETPFRSISFGSQRMALIARAMVKLPLLLILDEPCQGLDDENRERVLALIDYLAENGNTHVIHVTHDPGEHLRCITHQLTFEEKNGAYRGIITKRSSHP